MKKIAMCAALLLGVSFAAQAKVSADEAAHLGKGLTEVGAGRDRKKKTPCRRLAHIVTFFFLSPRP